MNSDKILNRIFQSEHFWNLLNKFMIKQKNFYDFTLNLIQVTKFMENSTNERAINYSLKQGSCVYPKFSIENKWNNRLIDPRDMTLPLIYWLKMKFQDMRPKELILVICSRNTDCKQTLSFRLLSRILCITQLVFFRKRKKLFFVLFYPSENLLFEIFGAKLLLV